MVTISKVFLVLHLQIFLYLDDNDDDDAKLMNGYLMYISVCKAQTPLCRLPRDVRDKPETSPDGEVSGKSA